MSDGVHDNTVAFHRAILKCEEAGGALGLFSKRFEDYPLVMSGYEGRQTVRCQSPLVGEGLEDVRSQVKLVEIADYYQA